MGSFSPDPPKPWVETPLIFSPPLSRAAGCNIFLKLENVQPSGSFKSRGVGNMMSRALQGDGDEDDGGQPVHFYCPSGGNAGLACAATAAALGCPATIVVPTSTSAFMVAKLRELGADVVQTGAGWAEADAYLRETFLCAPHPSSSRPPDNNNNDNNNTPQQQQQQQQQNEGNGNNARPAATARRVYVPPFDHPDIWAGVSTLVDEIARDVAGRFGNSERAAAVVVDAVVCSVGGGGLLNGVMDGLERCGKRLVARGGPGGQERVRVLAVETVGADSLHASVRAGELVTLPAITSIATSLGASRVSEKTWERVQRWGDGLVSATVTDAEAAMACVRFLDDARILIEVACGATVATAYNGDLRRYLGKGLTDEEWATRNVVLVVCGGSNISWAILEKYRKAYGIE